MQINKNNMQIAQSQKQVRSTITPSQRKHNNSNSWNLEAHYDLLAKYIIYGFLIIVGLAYM